MKIIGWILLTIIGLIILLLLTADEIDIEICNNDKILFKYEKKKSQDKNCKNS